MWWPAWHCRHSAGSLTLNKFEAKGPLTLYGNYRVLHTAKMALAASVDFTNNFNGPNGSLQTIGLPHFFCIRTAFDRGPRVTRTASAS